MVIMANLPLQSGRDRSAPATALPAVRSVPKKRYPLQTSYKDVVVEVYRRAHQMSVKTGLRRIKIRSGRWRMRGRFGQAGERTKVTAQGGPISSPQPRAGA